MVQLSSMKCVACRPDSPQASQQEIETLFAQISEWRIVERDRIRRLERAFAFKNFSEAMRFATRVGYIADEEDHHPVLLVEWGRVTVSWWTHVIGGLHRNDFIMAAKTDQIYAER